MNASGRDTSRRYLGDEPDDDIPDLSTPDWVEHFERTGVRGRPRLAAPKVQTTLRLDADVVAHFKATGPGWQTRINEALRKALG